MKKKKCKKIDKIDKMLYEYFENKVEEEIPESIYKTIDETIKKIKEGNLQKKAVLITAFK